MTEEIPHIPVEEFVSDKPNFMNDKLYWRVKWLVAIVLPSIGSLYFGLAQIWGLPNAENVVGSLALISTFLGITLGISSHAYANSGRKYDGAILVQVEHDDDTTTKRFTLALDGDPMQLDSKDEVVFKIKRS